MSETSGPWTIAEAKARLSELLRRAQTDGPQTIGLRERYVVIPEHIWAKTQRSRPSLGSWLATELQDSGALELPDRTEPRRPIPFDENGSSA
ncbi:MAG: type II toxin-antitoxin system prevent-host-death family antitoxin [Pseudomonadota bacterium]